MMPASFPAFSAVLMMGGQSTRMGSDKAMLPWPLRPLWQHQLDTLRTLAPAELLVSARPDQALCGDDFFRLHDAYSGRGPLAGISAALEAARTEWLIVLAVDLPAMTPDFLKRMMASAFAAQRGQIPERVGHLEPLAAIYPRAAASIAGALLSGSDHSLRHFIRVLEARGLVERVAVAAVETPLFRNLNTPADLQVDARRPSAG